MRENTENFAPAVWAFWFVNMRTSAAYKNQLGSPQHSKLIILVCGHYLTTQQRFDDNDFASCTATNGNPAIHSRAGRIPTQSIKCYCKTPTIWQGGTLLGRFTPHGNVKCWNKIIQWGSFGKTYIRDFLQSQLWDVQYPITVYLWKRPIATLFKIP